MIEFFSFILIFAGLMFIWTFVFLNRSHDQKNQSFIYFLSVLLVWMILNASNDLVDTSLLGLLLKTIYWYSLLTMSLFFLFFIYRLINRNPDHIFFFIVAIDLLTIAARYLFPIDYTDPTFWRLSTPIVAPLMSFIFSTPAIFSLYLIIKEYFFVHDLRKKAQLLYIFLGTGSALFISVISEYVLPTLFQIHIHTTLMYYALFVFVLFIFISIMKHRLLFLQSEYIYRKLFINSGEGIIIVNRFGRIVNINNTAKRIFHNEDLSSGALLSNYLKEYSFETNYSRNETMYTEADEIKYLLITQYPIDTERSGSEKLVMISDNSLAKRQHQMEKELLIQKSIIDPLTGVFTRQYLFDKFCTIPELQGDFKMSLLFIDIDNFKSINDLYGHLFGDMVLSELSSCIIRNVRENNEIIRYGGDEFILLLPDMDADQAYLVAERIRKSVIVDCSNIADKSVDVTISIGIIEGHPPITNLIMKADIAMYRSKVQGKNSISIYTDDGIRESSIE
jgi:diguanylate cyclase (GGDEF)-like protein